MVISFYSEINNVEVSPCSLKRKNSFGIEETQINLPVQKKLRKVFNNNNSNRTMSSSNYTLENASDIEPFVFVLNERERQLVDLFKNICDYIRQQCPEHPPITVRFVGGWVRDKVSDKKGFLINIITFLHIKLFF